MLVRHHLARQDVPKHGKGVEQSLVINGGMQILDHDVAHSGLAQVGVTLHPHHAAGPAVDGLEVEHVDGTLGVHGVVEVHVGVAVGEGGREGGRN